MRVVIVISILLISLDCLSQSVQTPGIDFPSYKLQDSSALILYSSIVYGQENSLRLLDPIVYFSNNSRYARGYNDGAVWKGEGLTSEIHGGFAIKRGKLSLVFQPVFFFSENQDWDYPDSLSRYPYGYPYSNSIDFVSRYGEKSFSQFHTGQSEIQFEIGKFTSSIGTANFTLGPAVFNPILMSNNAGGFPNLKIGIKPTYLTKKQNIGKIEAHLIYGILKESEYFDNNPDNDFRYFNGLTFAFAPKILPGLTLGVNRVLYKNTSYFKPKDLLSPIIKLEEGNVDGKPLANDSFDQMVSFIMNWSFPEVGFRAYLEFAKNDFTSNGGGIRPALVEPDHTRGYTAGFEKTLITNNESNYTIIYEHTNLSIGHRGWRATPSYYTHSINRQGYTNNGQIIGAGIGPGGNSDNLGITYSSSKLSMLLLLQRIEHDRDYFVNFIGNPNLHDMEYTASISSQIQLNRLDLFLGFSVSKNYSKNFGYVDYNNFGANLGARFKLQRQ